MRVVNGTQTIDTKYIYDTYGNVTETRQYKNYGTTSTQPSGAYLSYVNTYDTDLKTYILSSDPPLMPATVTTYDYGMGLPLTVTDPNGNTTTTTYDGVGRVNTIRYPGYGVGQENVKYTYPIPSGGYVGAPFAIKMEVRDDTISNYRSTWQIMDGLGRVIQTQSPYQTNGMLVVTDTSYNAFGLLWRNSNPRTVTQPGGSHYPPTATWADWTGIAYSTSEYDSLQRLDYVYSPDGTLDDFSYSGLETTVIDRNSHKKVQENDAFGRLVQVDEYTGSNPYTLYATTAYEYDRRDLLTKVTDSAGNMTTIHYDGYGRKDSMSDPDMGAWTYGYDVFGNLTGQTDARGCGTAITYDDLNRPTLKTYTGPGACNGTPDVTYTYDSTTGGNEGLGRRTGMSNSDASSTWVYNVLGQAANETHNIDGTNYNINGTFDAFGRPLSQTIPSNQSTETLTYNYNAMGALLSLTGTNTYVSQINYSASGQVKDQLLGNSLLQQSCYDSNTLRMTKLKVYTGTVLPCTDTPSSPRLNLSYTYQNNGNIQQLTDLTRNETLSYTYDELDRLDTVSGPYSQDYNYNPIGNITDASMITLLSPVSTGRSHTCGLTNAGGLKCWGSNTQGRLGDGTSIDRTSPVNVTGLSSGVSAVSAGGTHTCALTIVGGVKCWGKNANGQLGDGTTTQRLTPVDVSTLTSGVSAISTGGEHTCALTTAGGVKCWGDNAYGQLGDGTNTDRNAPVNVSGLTSGVVAIEVGENHTCAVTNTGGVKCWGRNAYGQLGDNSITDRNSPVDVNGLASGVSAVSAGEFHTCALLATGGLKCWGRNTQGQLGDSTTTQRNTPVDVNGLASGVSAVSSGADHTCARTTGAGAKCWGDNIDGQLGDGTNTDRLTPVDVSGLTSGVSAVFSGGDHACALLATGVLKCWGGNTSGQLGDGTLVNTNAPITSLFASSATYTYGDSAHKHAVTALSTGETYTYDANGNMITRVEGGLTYNQTFDAENRLISVTVSGQTTQFVYDGDGNLIKKIYPDNSKTIYIGSVYEVEKSAGGSVTSTTTYYPAGGGMRVDGTLYFVLKDLLGSASVTTNSSGNIVGEQRYYPFGETRLTTGSILTDKLYTSQREITGLGIYHYGARYYSPKLGRFIQPDTIVPGASNPQNLNRYSYGLNNPVSNNDPSGHCSVSVSMGPFGQIEINVSSNPCPWNDHKTADIGLDVKRSELREYNGPDMPDRPVPEWGDDLITLFEPDEYNGADMPSDDRPLALMSKNLKKGNNPDAKRGKEAHKNYRNALGDDYDYEHPLPSGKRPDAIDWKKNIVRELKPDNPRAVQRGTRQVQKYAEELFKITDKIWKYFVDTYKK